MRKFKVLVLTDHSNHSKLNSLYKLTKALSKHPNCAYIDVATRGTALNDPFFKKNLTNSLYVSMVNENLVFHADGRAFKWQLRREQISDYDVIWLRLPPPITEDFAKFLIKAAPTGIFINHPLSILRTGSKSFLLNFPDLCPSMRLCKKIEEIESFKDQHPIVLKPLHKYGGKGIIKIDGEQVWEGNQKLNWQQLRQKLTNQPFEFLAVEFLKAVGQGDKRIIVVNGQIVGTSLRIPAKDSWLCNAATGGRSELSEPNEDELNILNRVNRILSKMGVAMYGLDTLMGNHGKRVLSEINTTSIGGLAPISELTDRPIIRQAADLLWNYIIEKHNNNVNTDD